MVAIFVSDNRVTCEVVAGVRLHVDRHEAFVVAQTRSSHSWPRLPYRQHAFDGFTGFIFDHMPIQRVQDDGIDAKQGQRAAAGFHLRDVLNERVHIHVRLQTILHNFARDNSWYIRTGVTPEERKARCNESKHKNIRF